jgi:hypothetical protein
VTQRTPDLVAAEYVQFVRTADPWNRFNNVPDQLWRELVGLVGEQAATSHLAQAHNTFELLCGTNSKAPGADFE